MDDDVQKFLLRPLDKRDEALSEKEIESALSKIDSVAEAAIAAKHELETVRKQRLDFSDPATIQQRIRLQKLRYESGFISESEFFFSVLLMIERVHDSRVTASIRNGELKSTSALMDVVRKSHGLEADEDWRLTDAPPEYLALNSQWNEVSGKLLRETLVEFDLGEMADVHEANKVRFDRLREIGRRNAFQRDATCEALEHLIAQYEREADIARKAEAHMAACSFYGSALEGSLLLRCLRFKAEAVATAKLLTLQTGKKVHLDPLRWSLETLTEICILAGWLRNVETAQGLYSSLELSHSIRHLRNLVHPGKFLRDRTWSEIGANESSIAAAIYRSVRTALSH